jgi:ligand-binding sensor domain-containing protein/signal transduction histidine kinase
MRPLGQARGGLARLAALALGLVISLAVPAADPGAAAPAPGAADPHPASTRFRRVDPQQGLSQISALALAQDRDGLIWIGTQDGLNRYDGYDMRVHRSDPADPATLPDDRINALTLDAAGRLWVGTRGGLSRFDADAEHFVRLQAEAPAAAQPAEHDIHVLLTDRRGRIWVGSYGGLLMVDAGGERLQRVAALPDGRIEALAEDADGRLWIGTLGGAFRFDPADGTLDSPQLAAAGADDGLHGRIDAVLVDRDGRVWIGAVGAGLYRFDPSANQVQRFRHDPQDPGSLGSDHVRSLLQDRAGRLWIGTRAGLDLVETTEPGLRVRRFVHQRHDPTSLGNGRVMSLFEDRLGDLWAGTYNGGVSLLSRRANRFAVYGPERSATAAMRDPVVHSLAAAGEQALWIGSRSGLYRFDLEQAVLQDSAPTTGLAIGALQADGDALWLGSSVGVARRAADGSVDPLGQLPSAVATARVTAVMLDAERLWVGTYDRGLFVLDRHSFALLASYPTRSWVSTIEPVGDALVLACGSDGLHWFNADGSTRLHRHRSGADADSALPAGGITDLQAGADGRWWLASVGGGLLEMRLDAAGDPASARFLPFAGDRPLASPVVHALLADRRGRLWLATARGISRVDPTEGTVRNFAAADGAFDSDYGSAAGAALPSGLLAFGASAGFVVFDPEHVAADAAELSPAPAPLVTELRLWNRTLLPQARAPGSPLPLPPHRLVEPLRLPAAQARMLGLRFVRPEFVAPRSLLYRYRLDGFDRDWIEAPASERSATYTNLPAGSYLFRLQTSADGHFEQAAEAQLALQILPPWWQTWWAQAAGVALLAALLLGLHGLRLRGANRRRRELEQQVAERTAQLSEAKERAETALRDLQGTQRQLVVAEKMASLGQLVAGVAHEINTPIGIAVTAASHLQEGVHGLSGKLGSGRLTRSDLERWNADVEEAMRLILGSLDRAHTLIASFKQVAVDQSSEQQRQFDLGGFLTEVQFALQPSYRRSGHALVIDCPDGIALDTYPGALFRIVTNWVNNSLLHGFAGRERGHMRISARRDGDRVELRYQDDGVGMPLEVAARAFDPFFTTRRGSGGSGLGLHLVYNLATQLLGGEIQLHSVPGAGTRFVLSFPLQAPPRPAGKGG